MSEHVKPNRVFYGWYIVASCWFSFFITYGVVIFAIFVFYEPIHIDLGWSRGLFSATYSSGILAMAITGPVIGKLIDVYGGKLIMFAGALIIGSAVFSFSQVTEPWHFLLGYIAAGIGLAASSGISINALISRWFQKRRGLAIGITYTGMGVGGFVVSPIAELLIQSMDWQSTMMVFAILIWSTLIPLTLLVIKSDPYQLGLEPDGITTNTIDSSKKIKRSEVYAALPGVSLSQAIRTSKFLVVVFVFFTALFSSNGTFSQVQPFVLDLGFSTTTAAALLSLIGLLAAITKFTYGYLSDKVPMKSILTFSTAGATAAPILLLTVSTLDIPKWVFLLCPLPLGIAATAFSILAPITAASAFGIRHIGAISGSLTSCMLLGMAAGPVFMGTMHDATGAYTIPAAMAATGMLVAIICLLFGPKLVHEDSHASP